MQKIKSVADLQRIREQAEQTIKVRAKAGTQIIIGMGTCGIAAGARETMHTLLEELARRNLEANITTVGCIGMCVQEPLVDIVEPNKGRITYGRITADKVSRLVEEHLINHRVIREWVVGEMSPSVMGQSSEGGSAG